MKQINVYKVSKKNSVFEGLAIQEKLWSEKKTAHETSLYPNTPVLRFHDHNPILSTKQSR